MFPSSTRREITRHFNVAVVQQWQRKMPKSVIHNCRFANINLLINLLLFVPFSLPSSERAVSCEIGDERGKSRFQFCSQALAVSQSILIQDFVSATNFDENILLPVLFQSSLY